MTGSEFRKDIMNACFNHASAIMILTFVLSVGCTTTRYSTSIEKVEPPTKTVKAKRKARKPTTSQMAQQAAKPAPIVAENASAPELAAAILPKAAPDSIHQTDAASPADASISPPATNPDSQVANRESASFSPKANGRFRTLSPEIPSGLGPEIPIGIKAAETATKKAKLNEAHLIFDFPVTYNARVRKWIRYFQTTGRSSFRRWLERSTRYIPYIHSELKRAGLPTDIAYVAMIESGFSSSAVSHANAMGMWQFIAPTGERYGLSVDWWIDERRDYEKATKAAIGYMSDLFEQFGSWYLVAASYNMGENGVRRLIKRHKTNSFWDLADRGALPEETRNYVPKMLAAMLIAKAPALYGFRDLEFHVPFAFESYNAPGGTDLINLANHLGVSERSLTELNPELLKGFIPREVKSHRIRIPKGSRSAVAMYLNQAESATQ